jgi:hypothetical protein
MLQYTVLIPGTTTYDAHSFSSSTSIYLILLDCWRRALGLLGVRSMEFVIQLVERLDIIIIFFCSFSLKNLASDYPICRAALSAPVGLRKKSEDVDIMLPTQS